MFSDENKMVRYVCQQCDKKYEIYSSYYTHKRTKHQEPKIKCTVCYKAFHTTNQLYSHCFKDRCSSKTEPAVGQVTTEKKRVGLSAGFAFQDFIWGCGSQIPITSVRSGEYLENVAQSWFEPRSVIQKATIVALNAACVKYTRARLSTFKQQLFHVVSCAYLRSSSSTTILCSSIFLINDEESLGSIIIVFFMHK